MMHSEAVQEVCELLADYRRVGVPSIYNAMGEDPRDVIETFSLEILNLIVEVSERVDSTDRIVLGQTIFKSRNEWARDNLKTVLSAYCLLSQMPHRLERAPRLMTVDKSVKSLFHTVDKYHCVPQRMHGAKLSLAYQAIIAFHDAHYALEEMHGVDDLGFDALSETAGYPIEYIDYDVMVIDKEENAKYLVNHPKEAETLATLIVVMKELDLSVLKKALRIVRKQPDRREALLKLNEFRSVALTVAQIESVFNEVPKALVVGSL